MTSASPLGRLPPLPEPPLAIAVSACLTGANVRYDGGHRRDAWPHQALREMFAWHPVCPEAGIGLGVPREPIRLISFGGATRAVSVRDAAIDCTERLEGYADEQAGWLEEVDGCVFKAKSPSCGLFGAAVADAEGKPLHAAGRGVFAARIAARHPALPLEEGERLFNPAARENFVLRAFIHAHWRRCRAEGMTPGTLIAFHSACKVLLMAHDAAGCRRLGQLLGQQCPADIGALAGRYFRELMLCLARRPTRGSHANALAHLQGYVNGRAARRELARCIERYRQGGAPLAQPIALLRRRLEEQGAAYAAEQHYLRLHLPGWWRRGYHAA